MEFNVEILCTTNSIMTLILADLDVTEYLVFAVIHAYTAHTV